MAELRENAAGTNYDELIGDVIVGLLTKNVTVAEGENLKRGSVVGIISASGKYKLTSAAADDGSKVANAIVAKDIDASKGDTIGTVYVSGIFNREKLIIGADTTIDAHEEELRNAGIYLTSLK